MAKMIKCRCGYVARGQTDDEVVKKAEEHIQRDHPDVVGKVSREDVLGWIEET